MVQPEITSFLTTLVGLLGLLCICLLAFGRLGIGSVVAFLVAGIVVGQIHDLPPEKVHLLHEVAELGVVLLLFLIGLEITPPQLRGLGRDALILGVPQIAVSALVIGGYTWWRLTSWESAVVIALALSLSSTMIVVQVLKDRGELHSKWGRKTFAILLAQDLAIVPFLMIISLMAERGSESNADLPWAWALLRAGVIVIGIVFIGRFVLGRVLTIAMRQANEAAFVCAPSLPYWPPR